MNSGPYCDVFARYLNPSHEKRKLHHAIIQNGNITMRVLRSKESTSHLKETLHCNVYFLMKFPFFVRRNQVCDAIRSGIYSQRSICLIEYFAIRRDNQNTWIVNLSKLWTDLSNYYYFEWTFRIWGILNYLN